MLELINGPASETADDGASFFEGTVSPRWFNISDRKMDEANDFIREARAGRKSVRDLREAFSTSDFTLAAYAAIDSETLGQYQELPSVWRQYTDTTTVNDFRPKSLREKWFNQLGLKLVPELTEYPTAGAGEFHQFWVNVFKYGLRDAVSFEAIINNEAINELENIPTKFSRAAVQTEVINALANLLNVDPKTNLANGVNTQFFKNYTTGPFTGVNTTPDTKPLTADNLDAVLEMLATRKSPKSGLQIAMPDMIVVVPKALQRTMEKIAALQQIRITDGVTEEIYSNYLATTDYVVEPMLDSINTNVDASRTWFVLPKPRQARPASFAAFLRGYETPDLRVKVDAGRRLGGGDIEPRQGSFMIDDIQHRIRHIVGHQTGDPTFTYVSVAPAAP